MSYPNLTDYPAYRRDAASLRKRAQQAWIRDTWLWLAGLIRSLAFRRSADESMRQLGA